MTNDSLIIIDELGRGMLLETLEVITSGPSWRIILHAWLLQVLAKVIFVTQFALVELSKIFSLVRARRSYTKFASFFTACPLEYEPAVLGEKMLTSVIYLLVYYISLLDFSEPNMANYELYRLQYWARPKVEHNIEVDT